MLETRPLGPDWLHEYWLKHHHSSTYYYKQEPIKISPAHDGKYKPTATVLLVPDILILFANHLRVTLLIINKLWLWTLQFISFTPKYWHQKTAQDFLWWEFQYYFLLISNITQVQTVTVRQISHKNQLRTLVGTGPTLVQNTLLLICRWCSPPALW